MRLCTLCVREENLQMDVAPKASSRGKRDTVYGSSSEEDHKRARLSELDEEENQVTEFRAVYGSEYDTK